MNTDHESWTEDDLKKFLKNLLNHTVAIAN